MSAVVLDPMEASASTPVVVAAELCTASDSAAYPVLPMSAITVVKKKPARTQGIVRRLNGKTTLTFTTAAGHTFTGSLKTGRIQDKLPGDAAAAAVGRVRIVSSSHYRVELVTGATLDLQFHVSLRDSKPSDVTITFKGGRTEALRRTTVPARAATLTLEDVRAAVASQYAAEEQFFPNRKPTWNATDQMYRLDFRGRATVASCKNIIFVSDLEDCESIVFLLGKTGDDEFNCDFAAPFGPEEAMGVATALFMNSRGGSSCVVL